MRHNINGVGYSINFISSYQGQHHYMIALQGKEWRTSYDKIKTLPKHAIERKLYAAFKRDEMANLSLYAKRNGQNRGEVLNYVNR